MRSSLGAMGAIAQSQHNSLNFHFHIRLRYTLTSRQGSDSRLM
ncbi:hypothetical protein [Nostoc sp. UHCC 0870]|nr:hypothetical protein [Nostoc sp. UHCC 0870]